MSFVSVAFIVLLLSVVAARLSWGSSGREPEHPSTGRTSDRESARRFVTAFLGELETLEEFRRLKQELAGR